MWTLSVRLGKYEGSFYFSLAISAWFSVPRFLKQEEGGNVCWSDDKVFLEGENGATFPQRCPIFRSAV